MLINNNYFTEKRTIIHILVYKDETIINELPSFKVFDNLINWFSASDKYIFMSDMFQF